jgi:hypothetical protein
MLARGWQTIQPAVKKSGATSQTPRRSIRMLLPATLTGSHDAQSGIPHRRILLTALTARKRALGSGH